VCWEEARCRLGCFGGVIEHAADEFGGLDEQEVGGGRWSVSQEREKQKRNNEENIPEDYPGTAQTRSH